MDNMHFGGMKMGNHELPEIVTECHHSMETGTVNVYIYRLLGTSMNDLLQHDFYKKSNWIFYDNKALYFLEVILITCFVSTDMCPMSQHLKLWPTETGRPGRELKHTQCTC